MKKMQDVIGNERGKMFVGRRAELECFKAGLEASLGSSQIMVISGMGGIGKSALLLEMLRMGRERGAVAHWLDGRLCAPSSAGFLAHLKMMLNGKGEEDSPAGLLKCLVANTGGRPLLLGIDNADGAMTLEDWLGEEFFGCSPEAGMLLVLASRARVSSLWRHDPFWGQRTREMQLVPFERDEMGEYLARLGFAQVEKGNDVYRWTGGHPLAVIILAESIPRGEEETSRATLPRTIKGCLLQEVGSVESEDLLEILAVLPEADGDLLERILGVPISSARYLALTRFSAVGQGEGGLALHPVARLYLAADLRLRTPDRFRSLRRRALSALRVRLAMTTSQAQRWHIAAGILSICREAMPKSSWYDLGAVCQPDVSPFHPDDLGVLRLFLESRCRYLYGFTSNEARSEQCALDALCAEFPEGIRVARSAGGEPLGFFARLPIWRKTLPLIRQTIIGSLYFQGCPEELRDTLLRSAEEVDSTIAILSGPGPTGNDLDGAEFRGQEVQGALLNDYLSVLGENKRIIGAAVSPEIGAFFTRIGAVPIQGSRTVLSLKADPVELYQLDLRQRDFGAWASFLLDGLEGIKPRENPEIFAEELRTALELMGRPELRGETPLARRLGLSGEDFGRIITSMVERDLPPLPLDGTDQEILRKLLKGKNRRPESIAAQLHLSRSTYYRKLKIALHNLTQALLFSAQRGKTLADDERR